MLSSSCSLLVQLPAADAAADVSGCSLDLSGRAASLFAADVWPICSACSLLARCSAGCWPESDAFGAGLHAADIAEAATAPAAMFSCGQRPLELLRPPPPPGVLPVPPSLIGIVC